MFTAAENYATPQTVGATTENATLKQVARILAIVHSCLHLFIGPFELVVVVAFIVAFSWSNLLMFLIFLSAAGTKVTTLVFTFRATGTTTDTTSSSVYYIVFAFTMLANAAACLIVSYGNYKHVGNPVFTFIHIYFFNFVLVIAEVVITGLYVASKETTYYFLVQNPAAREQSKAQAPAESHQPKQQLYVYPQLPYQFY